MRLSRFRFHVPVVAFLALATACSSAVRAEEYAASPEQAIQTASANGTLLYLVFYREADATTNALLDTVKATAEQNSGTSWTTVHVADSAQRPVAERFKVTRAPMPMVIAVAANGAVTGAFQKRATPEALAGCIVSPKKAECMAALQADKLVLLCLQKDSPVNGTSATVFRADERPMRLGENGLGVWKRFPDKPKHRSGPATMAFFSHWSRPTPSRPVPGLGCLASDAAQRL